MALSDEVIDRVRCNTDIPQATDCDNLRLTKQHMRVFARAIEAEVRKQDDALIRQMLEAMQALNKLALTGEPVLWTAEFDRARAVADAARLRLEGKP